MEASVADAISEKYLPIKTKLSDEDAEDEDVHYLTKEQLSKFVALYNVVKYPRTREYMDMFLFAFHACGLRFSDILTLQWMHVDLEKHKLKKVLYKGQVPHEITLNDAAVKILEQWKMKKEVTALSLLCCLMILIWLMKKNLNECGLIKILL